MAKPDLPEFNSNDTDSIVPDSTHKSDGWQAPGGVPEKPPYQTFNWLQNRYYEWLQKINIQGILEYDNATDYIAIFSYAIGSDGNLYHCLINNGPASSVVDPVGDVTGTWLDVVNQVILPRGYIDGFILSNGTDADHDIDVTAGIAKDDPNTTQITKATSFTKQIDANWAEGDDAGGFPSGLTLLADTWYHFFVILKTDETLVDFGFDTSLTAANLLADATAYTAYRRLGSILTDGSLNILPFFQWGDDFRWKDRIEDFNGTPPATTIQTLTLSVPPDVNVMAKFRGCYYSVQNLFMYFFEVGETDIVPASIALCDLGGIINENEQPQIEFEMKTNTSAQIQYRANGTVDPFNVLTKGWRDARGKE